MTNCADHVCKPLEALLQEERKALLCADFKALEGLAERKEALVTALPETPETTPGWHRIKALSQGNAALLEAVMQGIRAAHQLVADSRAPRNFATYDRDGKRLPGPESGMAMERRA